MPTPVQMGVGHNGTLTIFSASAIIIIMTLNSTVVVLLALRNNYGDAQDFKKGLKGGERSLMYTPCSLLQVMYDLID